MIEHESAAVDLETPSDSDTDSGSAPYVPRRRGGEGNAEDLFRMRSVAVDPDMETPAPSDDEG